MPRIGCERFRERIVFVVRCSKYIGGGIIVLFNP